MRGEEIKGNSVDFAHLLSLVKDFGEDLGAVGVDETKRGLECRTAWSADGEVEAFAIHSPRSNELPPKPLQKKPPSLSLESMQALPASVETFSMISARGDACGEAPILSLEEQLQASLDETARLRLELARKDAEIAAFREREAARITSS